MMKAIIFLCTYRTDSAEAPSAVPPNLRVEPSPAEKEIILSTAAKEHLKRAQEAAINPSTAEPAATADTLGYTTGIDIPEVKPIRFECPKIKSSEPNGHLERKKITKARHTMTKQACEDECYTHPSCSGFTFSATSMTNPSIAPSATSSGMCQLYKDLAYSDIPGEDTDIFCRSKRCPYDVGVATECTCLPYNPNDNRAATTNECAQHLICRKDGTCGMRMMCSDRLCKSAYANASAWALCDTANKEDQGTCSAIVTYDGGCNTSEKGNYCDALKILDGKCKCRDKNTADVQMWSSTQQCSYDVVVATMHDVCFCMPRGVQTEGNVASDKLCTTGQVCTDDGVCACAEGHGKVYDAVTGALMCVPITKRMAIACCGDSQDAPQLHSAQDAQGDIDCFETASMYKAARVCLDLPERKTLCTADQIKKVHGSGTNLCRKGADDNSLPFWIIPRDKCVENTISEHDCYCERASDICTNGDICQLGGCIASCPEKKDKTTEYCGCIGNDGKVSICAMGQVCDPGLSKCEGDGFHVFPKGLCLSPETARWPTSGLAPVSRAECVHPPYSQVLLHDPTRCAELCTADDTCECYGFVAFMANGALACKRFYQKLDLSRITESECDHKDPTLYALSSERVCPDAKTSEIFYDKCHCGAQTCTRGMRCDQASGKCLYKCLCLTKKEPAWWSAPPECRSHNNVQCAACGGLLLLADDGQCKAGPNELCFAPETLNHDGTKTEAVPRVPCMHQRLCIVKDPGPEAAGKNVNCTYSTDACICEPIVAEAMSSSEEYQAETGENCGGSPNVSCREKGDTCVKKDIDDGKASCTDQLPLDACFCKGSGRWSTLLVVCTGSFVLLLVIGFFVIKFLRPSPSSTRALDPEVGSRSRDTTLSGNGGSESATEI